MRKLYASALLLCTASMSLRAQRPLSEIERRSAFGFSLLGLSPQGEFARNVDFAFGAGGHYLLALDSRGVIALRADLSFLNYGSEHWGVPLGNGPLGLVNVRVSTDHNIVDGGLGLQLGVPSGRVRPYINAAAGFSYFFTESSVSGRNDGDSFASSTNFDDGGFAWSSGGGISIPLSMRRHVVSLDLGVRYLDNGRRSYLREDGITFDDSDAAHLHPVRSNARAVQFGLGVNISFR